MSINRELCLGCEKGKAAYCEECYQKLIALNTKLQMENYEIKATYRKVASHFDEIGKKETAEYMLAQINDIPAWNVEENKSYIEKTTIKDIIENIKNTHSPEDSYACSQIHVLEKLLEV